MHSQYTTKSVQLLWKAHIEDKLVAGLECPYRPGDSSSLAEVFPFDCSCRFQRVQEYEVGNISVDLSIWKNLVTPVYWCGKFAFL